MHVAFVSSMQYSLFLCSIACAATFHFKFLFDTRVNRPNHGHLNCCFGEAVLDDISVLSAVSFAILPLAHFVPPSQSIAKTIEPFDLSQNALIFVLGSKG